MATLNAKGQVQYAGGEALPMVGSQAYLQAQQGILPTTPVTTSITGGALKNTTNPMTVTQPTPATGYTALAGAIEGGQVANTAADLEKQRIEQENADVATKQKKTASAYDMLVADITGNKGEIALTDEAYADGEVDAKKAEAEKLSMDIIAEQQALRRQVEDIEKNDVGAVGGGLSSKISRATTESVRKQADLAIVQMYAQGRFDSAKSIADRAVAAKLETQKQKNELLRFNYEENKEQFTKAEQRQFETAQRKRERELNKAEKYEERLNSLNTELMQSAAEQNAPISVLMAIQAAPTEAGKIQAAGKFGMSILEKLKVDELTASIAQKRAETEKTLAEAEEKSPEYKAAQKQGAVLSQLSLINDIVASPYVDQVFGLKNPFTYYTPGSNEQYVKNQVNQLRGNLSLENREKLKGQGAISDFEFKVLGQAASSLAPNLSNDASKRELNKIKGVFQNAAGLPAMVKISDPSTGKNVVVEATRETINQALMDGANVEYQ
jgi:hypothetical protein